MSLFIVSILIFVSGYESMPKEFYCCLCTKRCKAPLRKVCSGPFKKYIERFNKEHSNQHIVCDKCSRTFYRQKSQQFSEGTQSNVLETQVLHNVDSVDLVPSSQGSFRSPKSIPLNIPSTPRTHKYCIICQAKGNSRNRLCVIPSRARTQAFIESSVFIDSRNRCCPNHLDCKNFLTAEALEKVKRTKERDIYSRSDLTGILFNMREFLKESSHINFDMPYLMSDDDYISLTGLSKASFADLCSQCSGLRNTTVRTSRTCLAIVLVKLRLGLSNNILSILFGLKQTQIQRCIHAARTSLMQGFVPQNLGFQHITHDKFVEKHTTAISKSLFSTKEGQAIIVLDGTYVYIQKSTDYKLQRKCFSLHKGRPLVKPMVIVGTDGYILSVSGPYFADGANNDAAITKHMFAHDTEKINTWLQEDDICIVDRGFRDSVEFLKKRGYDVHMPSYLQKGQKQHSSEEANLSRLITKVRWVVESVNGRIKQFQFLNKVVPNKYLPYVGDFVKIVCGLINKYRSSLIDVSKGSELAQKMLQKSNEGNKLQSFLEEKNLLQKRTCYTPIKAADKILTDFPVMSLDDLRSITMGVYQLKQAPSYSREHLSEEGQYDLLVHKENPSVLKIKIQSRHTNSCQHSVWIEYNTSDGENPITGWYCTCKMGARVVGCCAHIASILWYLGFDRHAGKKVPTIRKAADALLNASALPDKDSICTEE